MSQQEFESLIMYLAAVPIFRKQLPRAELPRVAEAFKHMVWNPGDKLVEQGKDGKAFFIIKSGEAVVMVRDADGNEVERATLYCYDYFGGHTLTQKRPNVATIMAKGPQPLVTLSMSRRDFEALGLNRKLKFPRRPAIYGMHRTDAMADEPSAASASPLRREPLSATEVEFICKAIRANPNLRHAIGGVDEGNVMMLARTAVRKSVMQGATLAQCGELLRDFYVVSEGSFDVVLGSLYEHKSLEAVINNLTRIQKRLLDKEKFVADLQVPRAKPKYPRRACSLVVDAKNMQLDMKADAQATRNPARSRAQSLVGVQAILAKGEEMDLPFSVGDAVARVVVGDGLVQEVGKVLEVLRRGPSGEVKVSFQDPAQECILKVQELRPAKEMAPIASLTSGMCYGDLCLLYNTRLVTTCRAREDAVVYAISRRHFQNCFSRSTDSMEDHDTLLDDVHLLTPLLRSERWELARGAAGVFEFKPGERVLQQGQVPRQQLLYVLKSGSCIVKQNRTDESGKTETVELAKFVRAGHFGARAILGNDPAPEYSVDAGPHGMVCLAIHGQIVKKVLEKVDDLAGSPSTDLSCDISDLHTLIPKQNSRMVQDLPLWSLEIRELLGEGGFGQVFLARGNRKEYALKRLSKGYVVKAQATRQVQLERDILTMLDSRFIIRLYQTYQDEQYVYLLLELCTGGHLYQLLSDCKTSGSALLPSAVMYFIGSIIFALEHLHERHIAYRDLKAENVLLDAEGHVKLCDMGFAKFVVEKTHTLLGTPEYMAPEMIDPPHAHDSMVDWWALGVLTFELLTGQDPWYNCGIDSDGDPMAMLLALRDSHDDGIPERLLPRHQGLAKDFIKRLLCINVRKRLGFRGGAEEVRHDPWFTSKKFDFAGLLVGSLPPPVVPERRSEGSAASVPARLDEFAPGSSHFCPVVDDGTGWAKGF